MKSEKVKRLEKAAVNAFASAARFAAVGGKEKIVLQYKEYGNSLLNKLGEKKEETLDTELERVREKISTEYETVKSVREYFERERRAGNTSRFNETIQSLQQEEADILYTASVLT